jgi:hypothetical protein
MLNSYLALEKDPRNGQFHPLLSGFEDAGRIINGINRVHVAAKDDREYSPLRVIPTYPDLPMEECFPPPQSTNQAGVFVRQAGQGRVVYFPWDVDRTFWDVLNFDHAMLLRNAVEWATNETGPLSVEGKGVLDISVWEQKNSMTVHLVNLTNPMMMKGPLREVIPLSSQTVRVRLAEGRRLTKASLLVAGSEIPYREENGLIAIEVPTINVHEVVALDFAL